MKHIYIIILLITTLSYSQTKIPKSSVPEIEESMLSASLITKVNTTGTGLNGSKFLTATEVGLVTGNYNDTPPFTNQEYTDAYNNGINLANAIKQAYDDGYTGVVLENGVYPFTSNRGSTTIESGSKHFSCIIRDVHNFDIDFNNSTIFLIYDSLNRNPYDTSTDDIFTLPSQMINLRYCSFVTIHGLELRGDNYMRSWVTGERGDIGCYGITIAQNTQNTIIHNYEGHGFRCEPLAIGYDGIGWITLTWNSGGIDDAGADVVEVGSYTTPLLQLSILDPLINNSFSIVGQGYTREVPFRESLVKISYYDVNGAFLSSDFSVQNKLNYKPTNATHVRITAYGDERTDATVTYGSCQLTTGTPRSLEVYNCKFYNSMRGGIAGAANNTEIHHNVFHTLGSLITEKFGWLSYFPEETTTFAINVEDGMPDFVNIHDNRFEDVDHAFITPACQTIIFKDNICQNNFYNSVVEQCKYGNVSGNIFKGENGTGGGLEINLNAVNSERTAVVTDNEFLGTYFKAETNDNKNNSVSVSGNKYINTFVYYKNNVIADGNYSSSFKRGFGDGVTAENVLKFNDIIEADEDYTPWTRYSFDSRNRKSDALVNVKNAFRISLAKSLNIPSIHFTSDIERSIGINWDLNTVLIQNLHGTVFENINIGLGDGSSHETLPNFTQHYNGVEFDNSRITINRRTTTNGGDMVINFNYCKFDLTDVTDIITNNYANTGGTLTVNFFNCKFNSDTSKTVNITSGVGIVGLTVNNVEPIYRNVTLN